jgi:hypothetical protein
MTSEVSEWLVAQTSQTLLSDGTETVFGCFGEGSRSDEDGRGFLPSFSNESSRWLTRTRRQQAVQ